MSVLDQRRRRIELVGRDLASDHHLRSPRRRRLVAIRWRRQQHDACGAAPIVGIGHVCCHRDVRAVVVHHAAGDFHAASQCKYIIYLYTIMYSVWFG